MRLRTCISLFLMAAIFAGAGSLFGLAGATIALSVASLAVFWKFLHVDERLARVGAVQSTDQALLVIVRRVARRVQIPVPTVYEIDEEQPNAIVISALPAQTTLIVTRGLRSQLTGLEVEAVISHEFAHIASGDIVTSAASLALLEAILATSVVIAAFGLWLRRSGGGSLLAIGLLAPIVAVIVHLVASRSREYAADRFAVELMGTTQPMISALRQLERWAKRLDNQRAAMMPALISLWVIDPVPATWLSRIFSTHPPTEKRIARLVKLSECCGR